MCSTIKLKENWVLCELNKTQFYYNITEQVISFHPPVMLDDLETFMTKYNICHQVETINSLKSELLDLKSLDSISKPTQSKYKKVKKRNKQKKENSNDCESVNNSFPTFSQLSVDIASNSETEIFYNDKSDFQMLNKKRLKKKVPIKSKAIQQKSGNTSNQGSSSVSEEENEVLFRYYPQTSEESDYEIDDMRIITESNLKKYNSPNNILNTLKTNCNFDIKEYFSFRNDEINYSNNNSGKYTQCIIKSNMLNIEAIACSDSKRIARERAAQQFLKKYFPNLKWKELLEISKKNKFKKI